MRRIAFSGLIIAQMAVRVFAQTSSLEEIEKKGRSKFSISYGARLFLNNRDIKNDNVYPNALSTDNPCSFNHQAILDYQRTTRYGLIYGLALEHGNRTYSFNVDYKTVELVDRPTTVQFLDYKREYKLKTGYWGLKPFIGYAYDLKKNGLANWVIEAKAGVLISLQTKGYVSDAEPKPLAQYFTDDNKLVNISTETVVQMGKADQKKSGAVVGDLYLGISRRISGGIIRDVSLGFTFTNVLKYPSSKNQIITNYGMSTIITNYYYNGLRRPDRPISVDYYTPREMSLGLRCAVGLWWSKY